MAQLPENRIYFIDYLRGFMVMLVVFQHSMQAYSPFFQKQWYVKDTLSASIFDFWYLHNDIIMMPFLFFLAGMFVFPSLDRRGTLSFTKEKLMRLFVPFALGVFLLVPPQLYMKYLIKTAYPENYWHYVSDTFFWKEASSSGFWFLAALAMLTILLILVRKFAPFIIKGFDNFARWIIKNPIGGFLSISAIASIIIGISEIRWGPWFWFVFRDFGDLGQLIAFRKGRFIMKIFFFFLGAGVAGAGILQSKETLTKIGHSWKTWLILSLFSVGAYLYYAGTNFYTGAYNIEILRHFHFGGSWADSWPFINEYAPPILIRTTLLAVSMVSLTAFYFSAFQRFLDHPNKIWQSLGVCSFGIYIFHEPITTLVQYYFYQSQLNIFLKFTIVSIAATTISWGLTHFLRTKPGFKKVL